MRNLVVACVVAKPDNKFYDNIQELIINISRNFDGMVIVINDEHTNHKPGQRISDLVVMQELMTKGKVFHCRIVYSTSNSMAELRNLGLAAARLEQRYSHVCMIDIDERIAHERGVISLSPQQVINMFPDVDIFKVKLMGEQMRGDGTKSDYCDYLSSRFFKLAPDLYYEGSYHEQLRYNVAVERDIMQEDIPSFYIFHNGYCYANGEEAYNAGLARLSLISKKMLDDKDVNHGLTFIHKTLRGMGLYDVAQAIAPGL